MFRLKHKEGYFILVDFPVKGTALSEHCVLYRGALTVDEAYYDLVIAIPGGWDWTGAAC